MIVISSPLMQLLILFMEVVGRKDLGVALIFCYRSFKRLRYSLRNYWLRNWNELLIIVPHHDTSCILIITFFTTAILLLIDLTFIRVVLSAESAHMNLLSLYLLGLKYTDLNRGRGIIQWVLIHWIAWLPLHLSFFNRGCLILLGLLCFMIKVLRAASSEYIAVACSYLVDFVYIPDHDLVLVLILSLPLG